MEEAYVRSILKEKGLLEISFFHPKHNSLPSALLSKLATEIERAGKNEEVQLILLKSGGNRTFCAGASFDELQTIKDIETGTQFFSGFAAVINACRKCPKLIIGRVQGKAVGGGVGLAAAVDYCLASNYAAIKLSELHIGIGPFVISPAVERKVGKAAFIMMTLNPTTFFDAAWAKEKGLYAEVHDSPEALDNRCAELSTELLNTNPLARKHLKAIFWEGTDHWDQLLAERAALSGELVLSDFTKNALNKI